MAEKCFRVLLDLTDLHIEFLKYVWMNVSPQEIKTIGDFKTSVVHKINLENGDIKLFVRNGLLLDEETIMILREDDTVKVQFDSQHHSCFNHMGNSSKENKKLSRKRSYYENFSDMCLNTKRCKTDKILSEETEVLSDESCRKKKKKHKKSLSISYENILIQPDTVDTDKHNELKILKKKNKKISLPSEEFSEIMDSDLLFANQNNTVVKNKKIASNSGTSTTFSNNLNIDFTKDSLSSNVFPFIQENGLKEQRDLKTQDVKNTNVSSNNNCPKKKRKRHRKRKNAIETVDIASCDNDISNSKNESISFTHEANELMSLTCEDNVQRKHILYAFSPSKEQEVITLDSHNKAENSENLNSDTFVLDENAINLKPATKHPKISTPAQPNLCGTPNWCVSVMQKTTTNASEKNVKSNGINQSYSAASYNDKQREKPKTKENVAGHSYTDLPPLNSRPDIGTYIAYKVLELDQHYSPVLSNYREGIVKSINPDTDEIEIELLKHEIKPGRIGKFENLKEDETPPPEVLTNDTVIWSSMVEPKLLIN